MASLEISPRRKFLISVFFFFIILLIIWRIYSVPFTDGLLFFIALAFLFVIPGIVILQKLQSRFSILEFLILSTITAITLAGFGNMIVGYVCQSMVGHQVPSVRPFSFVWGGVFFIYFVIKLLQRKIILPPLKIPQGWLWLVALFIVLFVAWNGLYCNGYIRPDGRMGFDKAHDAESMLHLLFSAELIRGCPLILPFLHGDIPLNNYHFFSDLFVAQLHAVTWISIEDLFFRMTSTFVLMLILGAAWVAINRIAKNGKYALLWSMLILTGGDLSLHFLPIAYLLNPNNFTVMIFKGHLFHALTINLQTGMWIAIFCTAILVFHEMERNLSKGTIVLGGFLVGVSVQYFSFGGVTAIASLGILGTYYVLRLRKWEYFSAAVVAGSIALPMVIQSLLSSAKTKVFILSGGWHLITTAANLRIFDSFEEVTAAVHDLFPPVLVVLWILLFIISIGGTLGFRLWGFGVFLSDLRRFTSISGVRLMLAINAILGVFLATFTSLNFDGALNSPNTIFFLWLNTFIPMMFYGAIQFSRRYKWTTTARKRKAVVLLLFLALPQFLLLNGYFLGKKFTGFEKMYGIKLSAVEVTALQKLNTFGGDSWLLVPHWCFSSVVFGHRIFAHSCEDKRINFFLSRQIIDSRSELPRLIFSTTDPAQAAEALRPYKDIRFIFAPKEEPLKFLPVYWIKEIYVQNNVGLYEVLHDRIPNNP